MTWFWRWKKMHSLIVLVNISSFSDFLSHMFIQSFNYVLGEKIKLLICTPLVYYYLLLEMSVYWYVYKYWSSIFSSGMYQYIAYFHICQWKEKLIVLPSVSSLCENTKILWYPGCWWRSALRTCLSCASCCVISVKTLWS